MSKYKWSIAAACAASTVLASVASAAVTVDLRFAGPGDAKSRVSAPNTQYTVNFYAQVRGLDSNGANDGFNFLYGAIQSQQVGGGSVVGGSGVGVTSVTFHPAFSAAGFSSVPASGSNTSVDSIADWGLTTAAGSAIKPGVAIITQAYIGTASNGSTVQGSLLNNGSSGAGSEYLLGSFVFTTGANVTGLGSTLINWLEPTYTALNPKYHATYLDGVSTLDATGGGNFGGGYTQFASNGVALTVVPEPASIGLIAGGAAMLLGRRRRQTV